MKLMDEKGRLFGKVNIFDFVIFLAIVLVVGGVGYKLYQKNKAKSGQVSINYYVATVKCTAMPDTFAKVLEKDKRMYYETDGFVNAKIINVKEEPAVITVTTADGRLVDTQSPKLKDVYVDIEIAHKVDDVSIKIGRYAVCVGAKLTVKTVYAMGSEGLVIDLKEK